MVKPTAFKQECGDQPRGSDTWRFDSRREAQQAVVGGLEQPRVPFLVIANGGYCQSMLYLADVVGGCSLVSPL